MAESKTVASEQEIVVKIPAELEPFRDAIGAGLFYLALDPKPATHYPMNGCGPARIKLSPQASAYLDRLTPHYGSTRQTIINALAWVATQDEARRALLKNTVI